MHPILFRIPMPEGGLPISWILIAVAALFGVAALLAFRKGNTSSALTSGGLAAVALGVRFIGNVEVWELENIPIYSYGVMLGLSLVVGWYLTLGLAERDGLPKEVMANNYVVTAAAAVIGSRVLYVLTNLDEFDSFGSIFALRRGGLVAYGGFLGGFLGSYLYLKAKKLPLLPWADVAVPSLASGLLITRIGCYLFGCDFGRQLSEDSPAWLKDLGTFPHWPEETLESGDGSPAWVHHVDQGAITPDAEHSLPVHPTQLYESAVGLCLLVLLLLVRKRQIFRGQVFLVFTFAYGFLRFLLELVRDDAERGSVPPSMSEHILVPICLIAMGIAFATSFSKMIETVAIRRAAQGLAFVPAIAAYVMLRPETFGASTSYQLSTSQAVGLLSAIGAGFAFSAFFKSAKERPETAMALNIPPELYGTSEDDDDDDEPPAKRKKRSGGSKSEPAARRAKKRASTRNAKADPKAASKADDDDDRDDSDETPDDDAPDDDAPDDDAPDSDAPDSDVPDSDVNDSDVNDSDVNDDDAPDSDAPPRKAKAQSRRASTSSKASPSKARSTTRTGRATKKKRDPG